MQVAVVGGGVFGTALAWRLAVRGHQVALLEPEGFGHAGSASGDKSRIVRALYDDPAFAASGHASLALWEAWSKELGERLVELTGVLYLNEPGEAGAAFTARVDQGIANVKRLGGFAEALTPAEIKRQFPAIEVTGLSRGVFEPRAGFGRVALAARMFGRAAIQTGNVDRLAVRATAITEHAGAATGVAFPGGSVEAEVIVVAAGFDGAALVAPFAGDLGIRRLPHWTAYFRVDGPNAEMLRTPNLPCWADLGNALYGFPDDGRSGFKVAWHEPTVLNSPHAAEGRPSKAQIEELRRAAMRRFPALAKARCVDTFPCAYDATVDESFRIGPVRGIARLWFVGGLSGHGFKHAPAIAESLAAAIDGEPGVVDLAPFGWVNRA
jgi:glycine/D-amino acid oxidase-like deaminating enzyme